MADGKSDVMIIQSGEDRLIVGGKVLNMHSTGPGEWQGTSIEGGTTILIGPSDVIHIPAKTPHQFFLLKPGTQITYMLVKVIEP